MQKPKFYGTIKKGHKIELDDRNLFNLYVTKFNEGDRIEMTIARKYRRRTQGMTDEDTNFNGYWWKCIVKPVADYMHDYDLEYIHKIILLQIGHFRVDKFGNKHAEETKNLSGGEFSELCKKARTWASMELGLYLFEPYENENNGQ